MRNVWYSPASDNMMVPTQSTGRPEIQPVYNCPSLVFVFRPEIIRINALRCIALHCVYDAMLHHAC